ncbi:hypothetical protein EFM21_09270 [Leuconostoc falkenbergense]|nr:hypothetical protein [Leuconostoc falkenbergense]
MAKKAGFFNNPLKGQYLGHDPKNSDVSTVHQFDSQLSIIYIMLTNECQADVKVKTTCLIYW